MNVLFVSAEASPFIKTGGLADVAYALPKTLKKLGTDIRLIMPKYGDIPKQYKDKMQKVAEFGVSVGWRNQYCGLECLKNDGVTVYFIDNEYYFKRPGCYGYYDDSERFAFFCKAVLEAVPHMEGFVPDIIHANDWHTGMIPVLLSASYRNVPELKDTKTVYTIHNLGYQGTFSPAILGDLLSLPESYNTVDKLHHYEGVSFMKGGIVYSDAVTTVSKTYASEIMTEYYGEGLDGLLRAVSGKVSGIVNGIDYDSVNPETDTSIAANYTAKDFAEGKAKCKADLQREMGLPVRPDVPVISIVSRLCGQKGIDLISCVIDSIMNLDVQFIVLGSGDVEYEDFFTYNAGKYSDKISCKIGFDSKLANKIYAGSDMFLMPSKFEPCGIGQLIAMRYGTVPIVREVGGLKDTVKPYNKYTGEGTGFSFANYNAHEMLAAIETAVGLFNNKEIWNALITKGMEQNLDWTASAGVYLDLYENLEFAEASFPLQDEKRGRGRPRKNPFAEVKDADESAPKRGRGRPRKYLLAEADEGAADAPKRGRGRPRKLPEETSSENASVTESVKRGRGRPPKAQ